jgi:hypothetical protein
MSTPPRSAEVRAARGNLASKCAQYPKDHPEVVEARRALVAANLADHIERIVKGWPRLTNEQLNKCAALIQAGKT